MEKIALQKIYKSCIGLDKKIEGDFEQSIGTMEIKQIKYYDLGDYITLENNNSYPLVEASLLYFGDKNQEIDAMVDIYDVYHIHIDLYELSSYKFYKKVDTDEYIIIFPSEPETISFCSTSILKKYFNFSK